MNILILIKRLMKNVYRDCEEFRIRTTINKHILFNTKVPRLHKLTLDSQTTG